jgi:cytochrome c oxidase assembly protein subunit 15
MPFTRWIRRLAVAGVLLCFAVVVLGAYVRLSAAGLGCPDWPGCYGQLTPAGAEHNLSAPSAWPNRPLEPGKAWREMIHRYAAGTLAAVILAIAVLAIAARRQRVVKVWFALTLLAAVIVQGLLGMLTVTWQLRPAIVTLHLLLGMSTLALLWWLLLSLPVDSWGATSLRSAGRAIEGGANSPFAMARRLTLLGLLALALQIALGGWTSSNYAALACPDLPTCQGAWWPHTDYRHAFALHSAAQIDYEGGVLDNPARATIHVTHRVGALVTAVLLTLAALFVLRRRSFPGARLPAWLLLAALALQLVIGVSMVAKSFPLWLATSHTAGAALLLLATLAVLRRLSAR